MITDNVLSIGDVSIILYDQFGHIKDSREIKNLVVLAGRQFIASRMKDGGGLAQMSHMELGTGITSTSSSDTALQSPIAGSRQSLVVAGGTLTSNSLNFTATFGPGVGTGDITEAGIFNASSGGIMLARTVFSSIGKGALDSISISWDINILA